MKKVFTIISLVAVTTLLASCTKSDQPQQDKDLNIKVNITVNPENSTKAVKTGWVAGDKLFVFLEDVTGVKYLTLTNVDGTNSNWTAVKGGDLINDDIIDASGNKMYAIYFPFDTPVLASDGGEGVTFRSSGHTNTALNGLPIYSYFMTNGSAGSTFTASIEGESITIEATLNMTIPEGFVQFFINKSGSNYASSDQYRLSVQGLKPAACTSYSCGVFTKSELEAGQPVWGYYFNEEGVAFSGILDDSWGSASNHKFILFNDEAGTTSDGSGTAYPAITKTYDFLMNSHNAKRFNPGIYESFPNNLNTGWSRTLPEPSTIDFETSCLWAEKNLGAESPTGIGWKFGWGQIVPPSYYYYESWNPEKSITSNLTGKNVFYDVVRAYLGTGWRMPTIADVEAIMDGLSTYNMSLDYVTLDKKGKTIYFPITCYGRNANPTAGDSDVGYFYLSNFYGGGQSYYFYVDRYLEETEYNILPNYYGATIRPVKDK